MKTIVFHSYKGGVGRTLALSNLAHTLAELDQRVLIMDWDFNAPGLALKFGLDDKVKQGYVDYLVSTRKKYSEDYYDLAKLSDRDKRQDYLVECIYQIDRKAHEKGGIYILPAGKSGSGYWKKLASSEFRDYFNFQNTTKENDLFIQDFFKTDIELLESCPIDFPEYLDFKEFEEFDFLIIDSKTGSERAAVPLLVMADHYIEIFNMNHEGVYGEHLIRNAIMNQKPKMIDRYIPVVSRVPEGTSKDIIVSRYNEIFKSIIFNNSGGETDAHQHAYLEQLENLSSQSQSEAKIRFKLGKMPRSGEPKEARLCVLHENDGLELVEEMLLGNTIINGGNNRVITHDYLELFSELLSNNKKLSDKLKVFDTASLKVIMCIPPHVEEIKRFFHLNLKQGALSNTDNERNVALRVKTLNLMLDNLTKAMETTSETEGVSDEETSKLIQAACREAGCKAGEDFGVEATTPGKIWSSGEMDTFAKRMRKWCGFELKAGFGNWHYQADSNSIEIDASNHFLEESRYGDYFIRGYMEGVLSFLMLGTSTKVSVSVDIIESDRNRFSFSYGPLEDLFSSTRGIKRLFYDEYIKKIQSAISRRTSINELFNSLKNHITELEKEPDHTTVDWIKKNVRAITQSTCKTVGGYVGQAYGKDIIKNDVIWENGIIPKSLEKRLRDWCLADSQEGFGQWKYDHDKKQIIAEKHFLDDANPSGIDTHYGDHFIKGYIEGVISHLIPVSNEPILVDVVLKNEVENIFRFSYDSLLDTEITQASNLVESLYFYHIDKIQEDSKKNIIFEQIETITQNMKEIVSKVLSDEEAKSEISKGFKKIGKSLAQSIKNIVFLKNQREVSNENTSVNEQIDLWCEVDKMAIFNRLKYEYNNNKKGKIRVGSVFLNQTGFWNDLLSGYIEGTLNSILQAPTDQVVVDVSRQGEENVLLLVVH